MASKKMLWLKFYLDEKNTATFLNATESAKAAGYKAKSYSCFGVIGFENLKKHKIKINQWLEDYGLSEERLKLKLLSLLEAKETKFFQKDGKVTDQRDVEAIETQRRTLDMAIKVRGMYAAEKKDIKIGIEDVIANLPDGFREGVCRELTKLVSEK